MTVYYIWSEWRDSNSRPLEPHSSTLPPALHPDGAFLFSLRNARLILLHKLPLVKNFFKQVRIWKKKWIFSVQRDFLPQTIGFLFALCFFQKSQRFGGFAHRVFGVLQQRHEEKNLFLFYERLVAEPEYVGFDGGAIRYRSSHRKAKIIAPILQPSSPCVKI